MFDGLAYLRAFDQDSETAYGIQACENRPQAVCVLAYNVAGEQLQNTTYAMPESFSFQDLNSPHHIAVSNNMIILSGVNTSSMSNIFVFDTKTGSLSTIPLQFDRQLSTDDTLAFHPTKPLVYFSAMGGCMLRELDLQTMALGDIAEGDKSMCGGVSVTWMKIDTTGTTLIMGSLDGAGDATFIFKWQL